MFEKGIKIYRFVCTHYSLIKFFIIIGNFEMDTNIICVLYFCRMVYIDLRYELTANLHL